MVIKNQIDPPAPADTNIYHLTDKERKKMKIDALPGSLLEALDAIGKSNIARDALGEHIFNEFIGDKKT